MAELTPQMLESAAGHRYEFVPSTNVREPIFGRENVYRPWEAPPLDRGDETSPEVADHQEHVASMHAALFNLIPYELSPIAEKFTRHNILPDEKSPGYQGHHEARLLTLPELELSSEEFEDLTALEPKINDGTATMAEIVRHGALAGRRSGELAMLRIIGGYRAEYENPMMKEAVELLGPGFRKGPRRKFAVTGFDANFYRDSPIESLSLGYKRSLGVLPDGTEVGARYGYAIDVNPEHDFDPTLRDAIQSIAQDNSWDLVPAFQRPKALFNEILRKGPKHPRVIGAVIKLYMFNRSVDEKLKQRANLIRKEEFRREKYGASAIDSSRMYTTVSQKDVEDPFED